MTVTIYHNPVCNTSRKVLGILLDAGIEPVVIQYLRTPLSRVQLSALIDRMGVTVRAVLRSKEAVFGELNLADATLSDEALLDAIVIHPILLNRPIVDTPKGARLCRPPELVLDLIEPSGH